MKEWILRWGPAALIMAIIFFASSTPRQDIPDFDSWDVVAKKGSHMLGYALLAVAYQRALSWNRSISRFRFIAAFFLSCLYAASDEWHQRFTPGRSPSVRDVCIDASGAAIGLELWFLWLKRSGNRMRQSEKNEPEQAV